MLKLKVIMHHGEVVMRKVKDIVKPAGENVILAHRLLKNSVKGDEYIMMSEDFFNLSGGIKNEECRLHEEKYEGIGNVKTMIYYPNPLTDFPDIKATLWNKIAARAKLGVGTLQWIFRRNSLEDFKSLEGL
ncbi:MAG: DUF2652 domain-containing protein [SAR324 cluster bacterium]|nr:DUF2652 domain-containing protein [SAR324 cluster bacterium]